MKKGCKILTALIAVPPSNKLCPVAVLADAWADGAVEVK